MGFFTDAYDLFVIGIVSTLLKTQWHLGTGQLALLNAVMLGAAFLGALVFGRVADNIGRTRVYWMSAALMVIAAVGSALAPSLAVLVAFRFLLGFGVGGDYPVSAVLMSEYAGHRNRGRMVGLVFSAQAVGLVVGPLIALALLGGGAGPAADLARPARPGRRSPRPPPSGCAARCPSRPATRPEAGQPGRRPGARRRPAARPACGRSWPAAGCWSCWPGRRAAGSCSTTPTTATRSPPRRSSPSSPRTPPRPTTIAIQLAIFAVAAVPGYVLAIAQMDRIGHRRLQLIGFILMGACFAVIGLVPGMTTAVAPFLLVYGISYFFTEFGPNVTTFVLPGELFPTRVRATGHGISAGIGKLGAFIGVFLFPVLQNSLGLRGTLLLTAGRLRPRRAAHPGPARARRPQPGGDLRRGRGHRRAEQAIRGAAEPTAA